MKFSTGDKVVLKRTEEEGTIINILGKGMVEVEVNGVSFPVYENEIDHPYFNWFTDKKKVPKKESIVQEQLPVEKPKARQPRMARGIYLSFLPTYKMDNKEEVVDQVKVYLINETPLSVHFGYDVKIKERHLFKLEGTLHAFSDLYLHSVPFMEMSEQPRFHWDFIARDMGTAFNEMNGVLRIKPAKLFEQIMELQEKNLPSFSYLLLEDFIPRTPVEKKEKAKVEMKPSEVKVKGNWAEVFEAIPQYELDLHIEHLVEHLQGLSRTDILAIQMEALYKNLNLAIQNKQQRMIIIHGLGKGILRDAVHKVLRETPEVADFKNEWSGKYGFGATEVTFTYKEAKG